MSNTVSKHLKVNVKASENGKISTFSWLLCLQDLQWGDCLLAFCGQLSIILLFSQFLSLIFGFSVKITRLCFHHSANKFITLVKSWAIQFLSIWRWKWKHQKKVKLQRFHGYSAFKTSNGVTYRVPQNPSWICNVCCSPKQRSIKKRLPSAASKCSFYFFQVHPFISK